MTRAARRVLTILLRLLAPITLLVAAAIGATMPLCLIVAFAFMVAGFMVGWGATGSSFRRRQ